MSLKMITHPALSGVSHGFFTRAGGVSGGSYASLNCGRGSRDQPSDVAANRALVAKAMGVQPGDLAGLSQVHSASVVTLANRDQIDDLPNVQADALVTTVPGIALSVLTADCQPVLLADRAAGVIGAVHAGWKGTVSGLIEAAVAAMRALGADDITAVIGPSITQSAYEVGWDFMEDIIAENPDDKRFFAVGAGGKPMFDLPGLGLSRLRQAGVDAVFCGYCTYGDPQRFYSYRRACHQGEDDTGRLISAIVLSP